MIIARRITVFMFLVATVFLSTFELSGTAHAATSYSILVNKIGGTSARPMCLGTENGGTADGTLAIMWVCNGNADQQWSMVVSPFTVNAPSYAAPKVLINRKSGTCLSLPNRATGKYIIPIIRTCNYNYDVDQTWGIQYHSGGANSYINALSSPCLGVYGTVQSGAQPIVWACNNNDDQHWYWEQA